MIMTGDDSDAIVSCTSDAIDLTTLGRRSQASLSSTGLKLSQTCQFIHKLVLSIEYIYYILYILYTYYI